MSAVDLARATIRTLLLAGVTEFVLAPGSRNTPLSLELAEAESRQLLRLHVRIDERSAAFLALGLAKGGGAPAAVVSTSGTAVANFLPAVVEASLSQTPIAVVTANRPLAMLGTGANQTIKQLGIFGDFARVAVHVDDQRPGTWDAALRGAAFAMTGSPTGSGPVQIDLGLNPPLTPDDLDFITPVQHEEPKLHLTPDVDTVSLSLPPRSLVVLAECDGALAETAAIQAKAAGFPVHIEAGGALDVAADTMRAGSFLLRSCLLETHRPEHLLIVGRPTLGRSIPALAGAADVTVTVVSNDATLTNALGLDVPTIRASAVRIQGTPDRGFVDAWLTADAAAATVIDEQTRMVFDAGAVASIVHETQPDLLVVASSNPIRDLDERAVRRPQPTVVNRGAAGIDGLVSTAIGAALADQASDERNRQQVGSRTAIALLGDLAFLHDSNGLVLGPSEPRPDLTIVVINNDGGAIFASLEQGAPAYAEHFERVFSTPHGVSIQSLCAATSTPYRRCVDAAQLDAALAERPAGIRVIEVPVSREDERARRRDFTDRVIAAIDATQAR